MQGLVANRALKSSQNKRRVKIRKLDTRLGYWLRRAQEASFSAFAERVEAHEIWPGWFAIMLLIHENPCINQTALSIATGRDKSTLTATLRQMANAGLIRRQRDRADLRSFRLTLTRGGESVLRDLDIQARSHDRLLDSIVGVQRKSVLIGMLKKLTGELTSVSATARPRPRNGAPRARP